MLWKNYALSWIGSREMNQDAHISNEEMGLFAVADGVGGGYHGEIAAQIAVQLFLQHGREFSSMTELMNAIQQEILREALALIGKPQMGTTFTGLKIEGKKATLVHIGDSRCYRIRNGQLQALTQDHETYLEDAYTMVLSSYLGLDPNILPLEIQETQIELNPEDRFLLCTDGLSKQLTEDQILALYEQHRNAPPMLVEQLAQHAGQKHGSDNITILYLEPRTQ